MEGDYRLVCLRQEKERMAQAARWFHEKWGYPLELYQKSMADSLGAGVKVPAWYLCLCGEKIAGGLGVIENDFHPRRDLSPNVCAVYTEEAYRGKGIAGALLDFACRDMGVQGIGTLYLLTDHQGFYERYGWEFLCLVQGEGEASSSRMYVHTNKNFE